MANESKRLLGLVTSETGSFVITDPAVLSQPDKLGRVRKALSVMNETGEQTVRVMFKGAVHGLALIQKGLPDKSRVYGVYSGHDLVRLEVEFDENQRRGQGND